MVGLGGRPNADRFSVSRFPAEFFGRLRTEKRDGQPAPEDVIAAHFDLGILGSMRKPLPYSRQDIDHRVERNLVLDLEKITYHASHTAPPGNLS